MSLTIKVLLLVGGVFAGIALLRWWLWRPSYAPMMTEPNDPLMLQAMESARESLPRFKELLSQRWQSALIKLRFVSSSNEVEHLWAEVLEVLGEDELGVRLVTPPVTHVGVLHRLHRCTFDDVEDWQVRAADGKLHGGFTQRAMFAIARRDGHRLPKKLAEQEREYGPE